MGGTYHHVKSVILPVKFQWNQHFSTQNQFSTHVLRPVGLHRWRPPGAIGAEHGPVQATGEAWMAQQVDRNPWEHGDLTMENYVLTMKMEI